MRGVRPVKASSGKPVPSGLLHSPRAVSRTRRGHRRAVVGADWDVHRSILMPFCLLTLNTRLFSPHQLCNISTSSLYSDSSFPGMTPTTVVSPGNLIVRFCPYLSAQSCVDSMNSKGQRTQPSGAPVPSVMDLEMFFPNTYFVVFQSESPKSTDSWQDLVPGEVFPSVSVV